MLKPLLFAALILLSSHTIASELVFVAPPAELDISVPQANCMKAVDVIKNQDVALFKTIFYPISVTDAQVAQHLKKTHDEYYAKDYLGIKNFKLINYENFYFENAKNSNNDSVSSEAKRRDHNIQLWIGYHFDSINPQTNKEEVGGGHCRFALVEDNWYLLNLL
ncbi:hypothetical protein [Shewanella frigidimarina]|jgi:hypothetical protein|uniref:Uncharacterized protein n=1 Tax=Shewanella frigidimarina TaxID=56812 RepID=A0A106BZK6_SHEFR|nr:hypothetical protein [Shewanella frigidimarina]KVX01511.1 hypothetical protein AWJ07_17385 [Shewanella frigidimarina]|tara:strand:- start:55241 stop:55732 length:492 start_codon:yes stop_codon:yes gene_type:complete